MICFSCTAHQNRTDNSGQVDTNSRIHGLDSSSKNKTGFLDFVYEFKSINYPFVIGDSILWKSTIVEMRGLERIDPNKVDKYLDFEFERKDTVDFHELIRFYKVGQLSIDSEIFGLIYLKSYKSKYTDGGKKDIYKIVTFDSKGNLISQKDIAGFITDLSKGDDRSFWNRCSIDKDLNIKINIKEQVADYDLDTLYLVSETEKKLKIDKQGKIK